ncbi:MAG: hypothetical protein F4Z77_11565 [Dehalococcoidia bacterium]|nr:hypothetical protein [Dehalococcoidia bacterium]MYA53292.1 hypothetical protein [Dehalococcoidia bacterium]
MTDEQFQALNRSVGNLAVAVASLHSDVAELKADVGGLKSDVAALKDWGENQVMPFLRRIDDRLAAVERRFSNIEGRIATSEMRQSVIEQIVYKRDDPNPASA